MSRPLRALILLVFVAACGARDTSAPDTLDDACVILSQKPQYSRAFRATARKWHVPVHVQMATIYQESRFKADARTPFRWIIGVIPMGRQSSAYGYAQALDGTWDEYKAATHNYRAKRDDIRDATDFMGWYFNTSLERNGVALDDTRNQYLNYHEGHTGYRRGTHNRKAWLLRVADKVAARADTYQAQLATCRLRRW
jgi:hypothetical protein